MLTTPRRAVAATLAAAAALTASGCTLFGPTQLSVEDAGERYLNIVCTSNAAMDRADTILELAMNEIDAGGNPPPEPFFAAAAEARDTLQRSATLLGSENVAWPEQVAEEIELLQQALIIDVTYWQQQSQAASLEAAWDMPLPNVPAELASAAQAIRAGLNLSADTEGSCVGYENGHAALTD